MWCTAPLIWAGPPLLRVRVQEAIQRIFYRGERTRPMAIMGTTERYVEINFATMFAGRSFTQQEVQRTRQVAVVGYGVYEALFEKRGIDLPAGIFSHRPAPANVADLRR